MSDSDSKAGQLGFCKIFFNSSTRSSKGTGTLYWKRKFVLRNGTILLELLSSVHDYGTFAAYMAGEAGEMHGGGYAGDGFGAQLSAVLDLH